jgi:hypothetical protein
VAVEAEGELPGDATKFAVDPVEVDVCEAHWGDVVGDGEDGADFRGRRAAGAEFFGELFRGNRSMGLGIHHGGLDGAEPLFEGEGEIGLKAEGNEVGEEAEHGLGFDTGAIGNVSAQREVMLARPMGEEGDEEGEAGVEGGNAQISAQRIEGVGSGGGKAPPEVAMAPLRGVGTFEPGSGDAAAAEGDSGSDAAGELLLPPVDIGLIGGRRAVDDAALPDGKVGILERGLSGAGSWPPCNRAA